MTAVRNMFGPPPGSLAIAVFSRTRDGKVEVVNLHVYAPPPSGKLVSTFVLSDVFATKQEARDHVRAMMAGNKFHVIWLEQIFEQASADDRADAAVVHTDTP